MLTYTLKKGSETALDLRSVPYTWGGSSSTYAVHVEKSTGLVGKPSLKTADEFNWKYLHGTTPDLRNRRYQSKDISLQCWMEADSKQQLVERFNHFTGLFSYDDLILLKVTWATDNNNGGVAPNPHESKGIYDLVWLRGVEGVSYRWRKGKNYVSFVLRLADPYPMKRVCILEGEDGDGFDYDIVSESEIDIFTEDGAAVYDILSGSGHVDCGLNKCILVCGDVVHAKNSEDGDTLLTPVGRDYVTIIYDEI